MDITFRSLTDDDLPLMHAWLNEPCVVKWWEGDDVSWEGVVRDYGSANRDDSEHWLALLDDREIGWIQFWETSGSPEEFAPWWNLGMDRTAVGIDYLIGEPELRGKGVGPAMIRAFVDQVVFGMHPEWTHVGANPYEANVASWRALEKAGFRHLGTYQDKDGPCKLMVADRRTFGGIQLI